MSDDAASKIAMVRQRWDEFAERFTATANKRVTLQCAREMHANLHLDKAQRVLEVAAGAGLGSLDIAQRMAIGDGGANGEKKQQLVVTDLSPTMVGLAKETLRYVASDYLVGEVLNGIATGRVVSTMSLQLAPDPDAMLRETKRVLKAGGIAGFTIWGRPELSDNFTIDAAVNKELGLRDSAEHSNFGQGFERASSSVANRRGLRKCAHLAIPVRPGAQEWRQAREIPERAVSCRSRRAAARRFAVTKRFGDEWLDTKDTPIGLETYTIAAKTSSNMPLSFVRGAS
ncbi:Alanine--trna ligase [Globisporangium polare]